MSMSGFLGDRDGRAIIEGMARQVHKPSASSMQTPADGASRNVEGYGDLGRRELLHATSSRTSRSAAGSWARAARRTGRWPTPSSRPSTSGQGSWTGSGGASPSRERTRQWDRKVFRAIPYSHGRASTHLRRNCAGNETRPARLRPTDLRRSDTQLGEQDRHE